MDALTATLGPGAFLMLAGLAASAVVAGLLAGAFGIGGGAIIVPVLYTLLGALGVDEAVRMHVAVGTSLGVIVPTSIRSYLSHRKRGTPDASLLRRWTPFVVLGVVTGTTAAAYISGAGLRTVFAVFAFAVAAKMLLAKPHWRIGANLPGQPMLGAYGGFIGFVSVLMGIGGGIVTNTIMTLHGRDLRQAIGTSAFVGVLVSLPGVIGFVVTGWAVPGRPPFSLGYVNMAAVALYIPITLACAPLGVAAAHAVSKRALEVGFGVFLIVVGLRFVLA